VKEPSPDPATTGPQLAALRRRAGLSIRQLAESSGVTAGMISLVERGNSSLSLVTLQKILTALGSDLGAFFSGGREDQTGPVFRRQEMKTVHDGTRAYTLVYPRRPEIAIQVFDETLNPGPKPEFERPLCDVGGYVLSGVLCLEIKGRKLQTVRAGDAFYVPRGTTHRGYAAGTESVRLISFCSPPEY
jgi:transcriptional regulator with XRE-family HTH domain